MQFGQQKKPPSNARVKKPRKPRPLGPDRLWLAAQVPIYPNFASIAYLLTQVRNHPLFSVFPLAEMPGMLNALRTLTKYKKLMRLHEGMYARPAYPSNLDRHYTRAKRRTPKQLAADAKIVRGSTIPHPGKRAEALHREIQTLKTAIAAHLDPSHPEFYDWRKDLGRPVVFDKEGKKIFIDTSSAPLDKYTTEE